MRKWRGPTDHNDARGTLARFRALLSSRSSARGKRNCRSVILSVKYQYGAVSAWLARSCCLKINKKNPLSHETERGVGGAEVVGGRGGGGEGGDAER